jgi:hypothetical protein
MIYIAPPPLFSIDILQAWKSRLEIAKEHPLLLEELVLNIGLNHLIMGFQVISLSQSIVKVKEPRFDLCLLLLVMVGDKGHELVHTFKVS